MKSSNQNDTGRASVGILVAIILTLTAAGFLWAQSVKVSELPATTTLGPTDNLLLVQSNITKRITGSNAVTSIIGTGSTNITTLGTITNGTWQGTTVAIANGGTGATNQATARANLDTPGLTANNTFTGSNTFNGSTTANGPTVLAGNTTVSGNVTFGNATQARTALSINATNTPSTPTGSVSASNVDSAIAELASEKGDLAGNNTWTGANRFPSTGVFFGANSTAGAGIKPYYNGANNVVLVNGNDSAPVTLRVAGITTTTAANGDGANSGFLDGSGLRLAVDKPFMWVSTSNAWATTPDVGISRAGVGTLAIGNGTAGNASGNLTLQNITANGTVTGNGNWVVGDSASDTATINAETTFGASTNTAWAARKPVAGDVGDARYGSLIPTVQEWDLKSVIKTATAGITFSVDDEFGWQRINWTSGNLTGQTAVIRGPKVFGAPAAGSGIYFSNPFRLVFDFNGVVRTNLVLRVLVGTSSSQTTTLAGKGIGFEIDSDTTIKLLTHNGTTLSTSNSTATGMDFNAIRRVVLENTGTGTVRLYAGTMTQQAWATPLIISTGGPTGFSADNTGEYSVVQMEGLGTPNASGALMINNPLFISR